MVKLHDTELIEYSSNQIILQSTDTFSVRPVVMKLQTFHKYCSFILKIPPEFYFEHCTQLPDPVFRCLAKVKSDSLTKIGRFF